MCVPTIALCLLLCGCGGTGETLSGAETARQPYQAMTGCTMEAEVLWSGESETVQTFTLRCDYVPEGESTVEVLAPESVAGIRAVVDGETMALAYEDLVLNAGTASGEQLSPAVCLPRLMSALRNGWLLEENGETLDGVDCLRLSLDETGQAGGKIVSTVWLRQEDGTPLQGEVSVDGTILLQARFTEFEFRDIMP
jgi:outer membrane lipoprotein-sorting protein